MEKTRGIVVEISKRYLVILTPEGDYIKVPHPGRKVSYGEEITCRLPLSVWPKAAVAAVSVAAAILILFGTSFLEMPFDWLPREENQIGGYLALDVNPSMEIVYDDNLEVISCSFLNRETADLMEGSLQGQPLQKVINYLLTQSVAMEYIGSEDGGDLVMATLVQVGEVEISTGDIGDIIDNCLSRLEISGRIAVFEVEEQTREKAESEGVSLNRYLLKKHLQQEGENIPKEASLLEMLESLEEKKLPGGVFEITEIPEKDEAPEGVPEEKPDPVPEEAPEIVPDLDNKDEGDLPSLP